MGAIASRYQENPKSRKLEQKVKSTQTLSLPALYIQGDADGVNPVYTGDAVPKKFTGSFQRIVLPGVGHFPSREAPEELSRILISFLRPSQI